MFGKTPRATDRDIKLLELDTNSKDNSKKAQTLEKGKCLATAFLLFPDRRQNGELILTLKNDYTKQQRNYSKTLTYIYGLMVNFYPTSVAVVTGVNNEGLNF